MTGTHKENWVLAQKGETFLQAGKYDLAIEIFSSIKNPSAWVLAHLGKAYQLNQSPDQAIDCFRKATAKQENYSWAYANWGETLRLIGREYKPEAREKFDIAIQYAPKYIWAIAHRGASYDFTDPQQLHPALHDFDKAIALYDEYAWAIAFRSATLFLLHREREAYMELLRAARLDPTIFSDDDTIKQLRIFVDTGEWVLTKAELRLR
jgi:tetratricopeptide (TPR) repeat protein